MGTCYYQGKAGLKYLLDKKLIQKKDYSNMIKIKKLSKAYLMVKDNKLGSVFTFKIIRDWKSVLEVSAKLKTFGYEEYSIKEGAQIDIIVGTSKIRLYNSGGRLTNVINEDGNLETAAKPSTALQEDAVVWCLNNNKFDKDKIREDLKFNFDKTWNESFEKTFTAIKKLSGKDKIDIKSYVTYRDSNTKKPQFLNAMTDSAILPDKKDNWNPSDIWMVKKGYDGKDILELCKKIKAGNETFVALNNLIKEHFESRKLIGISLKQVTSSKASIKKMEVDIDLVKSIKFLRITRKQIMSALNSYYDINFQYSEAGKTKNYIFRFRPKGKSGSLKVYMEGKPPERKTFDGAVSKDMLNKKFFKSDLIDFEKKIDKMSAKDMTVKEFIGTADADLYDFILKSNDYVDITDLDKKGNTEYITKRGTIITFFLYLIARENKNIIFKECLLSSLKINDFSSIHYKVF